MSVGASMPPSEKSPFQKVVDELTGGCGCACHAGTGYRSQCEHCTLGSSQYINKTVHIEMLAVQEQMRGLISYIAELRKHLHHHIGCLKAKNRYHLRDSREECDMCRAELVDCERLLALHYKGGVVA